LLVGCCGWGSGTLCWIPTCSSGLFVCMAALGGWCGFLLGLAWGLAWVVGLVLLWSSVAGCCQSSFALGLAAVSFWRTVGVSTASRRHHMYPYARGWTSWSGKGLSGSSAGLVVETGVRNLIRFISRTWQSRWLLQHDHSGSVERRHKQTRTRCMLLSTLKHNSRQTSQPPFP
jgi:hypothetical protein